MSQHAPRTRYTDQYLIKKTFSKAHIIIMFNLQPACYLYFN